MVLKDCAGLAALPLLAKEPIHKGRFIRFFVEVTI
jgi:hypothetical protein